MVESGNMGGNGAGRIVAAATALFVENGYAGTSMTKVASSAGMQKASVYHHFESKEALFIACVTSGANAGLEDLDAIALRDDLQPEEKLRRALSVAHDTIVGSAVGRMSPIIAETSRAIPAVARRFWDEHIDRMQTVVGRIVDEGVAAGAFSTVDPITFRMMAFGPIVYLSVSQQMFSRFEDLAPHFDTERSRTAHIDAVMAWIGKSG